MKRSELAKMARAIRQEFSSPDEYRPGRGGRLVRRPGKIDIDAASEVGASPRKLRAFKLRHGIAASDADLKAHLPGGRSAYAF
jgi:hypothetical protein